MIDSLLEGGYGDPVGVLDQDRSLWGKELLGAPILGGDDLLPQLARHGSTHFVVGLGAIGDNKPRQLLFELGLEHGLTPLTIRHPASICSPFATVGEGSVIFPGAVINAGASLGVNVIVNSGAIVEHDCVVGDHAHIATGSRLCSTVHVGPSSHIGAGATVRQCISVGEGAVVGAGSSVVKDVKPWTVVTGVPATVLERRGASSSNLSPTSSRVVS